MTTATATFRDYAFEDLAGGTFSIDTGGEHASISMATNHPEFAVTTELSREAARDMGTFIIRCAGNPSLHGEDEFIGENNYAVRVSAVDGEMSISVNSVNTDGEEDLYAEYDPTQEQSVDLAQRLIVWAGIAPVTADV